MLNIVHVRKETVNVLQLIQNDQQFHASAQTLSFVNIYLMYTNSSSMKH